MTQLFSFGLLMFLQRKPFTAAAVSGYNVFTHHTAIRAGNERYLEEHNEPYAENPLRAPAQRQTGSR